MSGDNELLELVKSKRPEKRSALPPSQAAPTEEGGEPERRVHPRDMKAYQAFGSGDKLTAPEQFELFSSGGCSRLVEYHTLLGINYHPSRGILLTCVGQKVLIEGKQLERLVLDLQHHRVSWVWEFPEKRGRELGQGSVVTSIHVLGQDGLMELDDAIAHEIKEFEKK